MTAIFNALKLPFAKLGRWWPRRAQPTEEQESSEKSLEEAIKEFTLQPAADDEAGETPSDTRLSWKLRLQNWLERLPFGKRITLDTNEESSAEKSAWKTRFKSLLARLPSLHKRKTEEEEVEADDLAAPIKHRNRLEKEDAEDEEAEAVKPSFLAPLKTSFSGFVARLPSLRKRKTEEEVETEADNLAAPIKRRSRLEEENAEDEAVKPTFLAPLKTSFFGFVARLPSLRKRKTEDDEVEAEAGDLAAPIKRRSRLEEENAEDEEAKIVKPSFMAQLKSTCTRTSAKIIYVTLLVAGAVIASQYSMWQILEKQKEEMDALQSANIELDKEKRELEKQTEEMDALQSANAELDREKRELEKQNQQLAAKQVAPGTVGNNGGLVMNNASSSMSGASRSGSSSGDCTVTNAKDVKTVLKNCIHEYNAMTGR